MTLRADYTKVPAEDYAAGMVTFYMLMDPKLVQEA